MQLKGPWDSSSKRNWIAECRDVIQKKGTRSSYVSRILGEKTVLSLPLPHPSSLPPSLSLPFPPISYPSFNPPSAYLSIYQLHATYNCLSKYIFTYLCLPLSLLQNLQGPLALSRQIDWGLQHNQEEINLHKNSTLAPVPATLRSLWWGHESTYLREQIMGDLMIILPYLSSYSRKRKVVPGVRQPRDLILNRVCLHYSVDTVCRGKTSLLDIKSPGSYF